MCISKSVLVVFGGRHFETTGLLRPLLPLLPSVSVIILCTSLQGVNSLGNFEFPSILDTKLEPSSHSYDLFHFLGSWYAQMAYKAPKIGFCFIRFNIVYIF